MFDTTEPRPKRRSDVFDFNFHICADVASRGFSIRSYSKTLVPEPPRHELSRNSTSVPSCLRLNSTPVETEQLVFDEKRKIRNTVRRVYNYLLRGILRPSPSPERANIHRTRSRDSEIQIIRNIRAAIRFLIYSAAVSPGTRRVPAKV